MAIVGHHPESGVRLVLERARDGGPPWRYSGDAFTPEARFTMRVFVEATGAVQIEIDGCPDAAVSAPLVDKAKLIVRAAFKHAQADMGESSPAPPPRRIVRWRGDK